eukprot:2530690-Rhodomonas_salina.2
MTDVGEDEGRSGVGGGDGGVPQTSGRKRQLSQSSDDDEYVAVSPSRLVDAIGVGCDWLWIRSEVAVQ